MLFLQIDYHQLAGALPHYEIHRLIILNFGHRNNMFTRFAVARNGTRLCLVTIKSTSASLGTYGVLLTGSESLWIITVLINLRS